MLIGQDTRYKEQFVLWETEVAIEKECRLIGVNLDNWRRLNPATCPGVLQSAGAVFVSYSPHILAEAIRYWEPPKPHTDRWYYYPDQSYQALGYEIKGDTAVRPPRRNPFA